MVIFIYFLVVAIVGGILSSYVIINNKQIKIVREKSKLYKKIIDLNSLYEFNPIFSRGIYLTFKPKSKQKFDNLDFYKIVEDKLKENKYFYNALFYKIKINQRKYKEYSNRYILLEKYTTEEEFLKFENMKIGYNTFFNCERKFYNKLKMKSPVVEYIVKCHAKFSNRYGKYIYKDKTFNFEQLQKILNKINDNCRMEIQQQEKLKKQILIGEKRRQSLEKARIAKAKKRKELKLLRVKQMERFIERYNTFIADNIVMKYIKAFVKSNLLTVEGNILLLFIPSIEKTKNKNLDFYKHVKYIQLFNEDSIKQLSKYKKSRILFFLKNNQVLNSVYNSEINDSIFFELQMEKKDRYYRNGKKYYLEFIDSVSRKEIVNRFEFVCDALKNKGIIDDMEIDKEILFLILGELYFIKTCNEHLRNYRRYKEKFSRSKDNEEFAKKLFLNKKNASEILSILNGKSIEEKKFTIDVFYENKKLVYEVADKIEKERKSEEYLSNLLNYENEKKSYFNSRYR